MAAHRRGGRCGAAVGDRVEDGLVLGVGTGGAAGLAEGLGAALGDLLGDGAHELGEDAAVRGSRDRRVEQAVAVDAGPAVLDLLGHVRERLAHRGQVVLRTALGGQFGEFRLQGLAGVEDVGEASAALDQLLHGLHVEAVPDEVGAAAVPRLHQALDLQHHDGLLHRGPADAEALGEVALGRETVAGLEVTLGDVLAQPVQHLLVEALLAHGAQGVGHRVPLSWGG